MTQNEDELNTNIRQALDESVDALDASTLAKIRQIRAQAVEKASAKSFNWFGVMSGGLATACVMVIAVMILMQTPTSIQPAPVEDLDLISSSENLELYEDLEFYEWLAEYELQG